MENGLEVASKKFEQIEIIYSLEFIDSDEKLLIIGKGSDEEKLKFITWDLYNTGKVETVMLDDFIRIEDFSTRLVRTSGNILYVNDNGNVISVLKQIRSKQEQPVKPEYPDIELREKRGIKLDGRPDDKHIIRFDKSEFIPIVVEKEPWMMNDYERHSYCLHRTKTDTLQLIIGRSTVQIWHQIHDKDHGPNKGEPFLEYIWTNGIPVNQERKKTRLRIEMIKNVKDVIKDESNGILNDFYLKVYWYQRISGKKIDKENEKAIIADENIEINELEALTMDGIREKRSLVERKEKVIQRKDILDKVSTVRHACKALEHLNKRYKSNWLANNYIRINEVS